MHRDGRETGVDRAYRRAAMRDVGRGQMERADPHRGPVQAVVASAASSADALVEEPLHAASAVSKYRLRRRQAGGKGEIVRCADGAKRECGDVERDTVR